MTEKNEKVVGINAAVVAALARLDEREDPSEPVATLMPAAPEEIPAEAAPPVVLIDMGLRITQSGHLRTTQVFDGDGKQLPIIALVGLCHACADSIASIDGFAPELRNACRRIGKTMHELTRLQAARKMSTLCNGHHPRCAIRVWAAAPKVNGSAAMPPPCDCGYIAPGVSS